MPYLIRVQPSGHEFEAQNTETILQAGLRSGLNLSYSCQNGSCGECRVRLLAGQVEANGYSDFPISEAERNAGWVLGCCSRAVSDLEIEAREIGSVEQIPEQTLKVKVERLEPMGDAAMVLHLRTSRSKLLRFLAGQRIRVRLGPGLERELPLASCPCDGRNLRVHLPKLAGDAFSEWVFDRLGPRQEVELHGPCGRFTLDEDNPRPLLFIAEETGFAAVESLIEHAISLEWEYSIALYWLSARPGGRYLGNYCRSWVDALDDFLYQGLALSPTGSCSGREAVAGILAAAAPDPEWAIYAAVSPAVAAELAAASRAAGLAEEQIKLELLEPI